MNMAQDIRVRTDQHYRTLYNDFRNFVAKDMHEIFFLCVCLGYRDGKRKPLGRSKDDRFWSNTITPEEYASFYAIMIESNNMEFSSISDDKIVIATMEEYANAGMQILLDDVLADYILKRGDDLHLDPSCSKELPKVLLAHVYEKAGQ
jgi:hypothetical protein